MRDRKLSELRVKASELIHKKLKNAPFVAVKYSEDGAMAYCVWQDGVKEYLFVEYSDLEPQSQHDRAMAYLHGVK